MNAVADADSVRPFPPGAERAGQLAVVPREDADSLMARLGALDTYTCTAYQRASVLLEPPGAEPVLLHFRDDGGEMALPLILRPLPDGRGWDATSAYGYGGPVAQGRPDVAAFGAALDAWARDQAVVTTFLRLNPLLENGWLVPPTFEIVDAGHTVAWDVSSGRDLLAALHSDHRRSVRKADRAGLEIDVVSRPSSLDEFRELYDVTMRRLDAGAYFYFPSEYWAALLAQDHALRPVLVGGRLDGRLVAGLLCFASGEYVHAHLSANDDVARSIGATTRCYLVAAQWAQQQGAEILHLGGGLGANDPSTLVGFKHRFDPRSRPRRFQVAKRVHDRQRYRELAGGDSTEGFFPPWRRPR